ncbi:hypothetical protein TNCV_499771 [Trichonephila clavipes]|nr:hypothetical protein TNCV_499771 [Trichonephila clavipes]
MSKVPPSKLRRERRPLRGQKQAGRGAEDFNVNDRKSIIFKKQSSVPDFSCLQGLLTIDFKFSSSPCVTREKQTLSIPQVGGVRVDQSSSGDTNNLLRNMRRNVFFYFVQHISVKEEWNKKKKSSFLRTLFVEETQSKNYDDNSKVKGYVVSQVLGILVPPRNGGCGGVRYATGHSSLRKLNGRRPLPQHDQMTMAIAILAANSSFES